MTDNDQITNLAIIVLIIFGVRYFIKFTEKKENFTHINLDTTDNKYYEYGSLPGYGAPDNIYEDYNYVHQHPIYSPASDYDYDNTDKSIDESNYGIELTDDPITHDELNDYPEEIYDNHNDQAFFGSDISHIDDLAENYPKLDSTYEIPINQLDDFHTNETGADKVCNINRFNDFGDLYEKKTGKEGKCYPSMSSCTQRDPSKERVDHNDYNPYFRGMDGHERKYCKENLPNNALHDKKTFFENNKGKSIREIYNKLVDNDYNTGINKRIKEGDFFALGDNQCRIFKKDNWSYENENVNNGGVIKEGLYANDPLNDKYLALV